MWRVLEIPEEMQGTLILPFLSDTVRASVISQLLSGTLSYVELNKSVLKELKMTPTEYRRRFLDIEKETGKSWSKLAVGLETVFCYYLRSREME